MSDIVFDHERLARTGLSEAVYCPGKRIEHLEALITSNAKDGRPLLLTRLDADVLGRLDPTVRSAMDYDAVSRTALVGVLPEPKEEPRIAVVTAGTADLPVAREAVRTLRFHGHNAIELSDCGVAGLWRLLRHEQLLRRMAVVIAVAGMEGAVFSVLGGLVPGVVIAVPTSTGYGVTQGGHVALGSALGSCAPGLVCVNVDNGYGAACAAVRVLGSKPGLGASSTLG